MKDNSSLDWGHSSPLSPECSRAQGFRRHSLVQLGRGHPCWAVGHTSSLLVHSASSRYPMGEKRPEQDSSCSPHSYPLVDSDHNSSLFEPYHYWDPPGFFHPPPLSPNNYHAMMVVSCPNQILPWRHSSSGRSQLRGQTGVSSYAS